MTNKNAEADVVSIDGAVRIAASMRKRGKKLVVLNGSFDLLHSGHLSLIKKARSYGDALLILVNSDRSVRRYKGPSRPIVPQGERMRMLAGVVGVDYVAVFDDLNPKKVLARIRPSVYCNGSDWGKNSVERSVVEKYGGTIKVIPLVKGYSSSQLIRSVIQADKTPTVRAVFLDRDGTINDNGDGYVHTKEKFTFLPGVVSALKVLSKTDFKIVVVTNQSVIGRGHATKKDVERLHSWMVSTLRKKGVRIDAVYFCPHHPEDHCDCRKPGTVLLERAAEDFGLSLAKSWFIGDGESDVLAGREANIKTVKIGKRMNPSLKLEPDFYAKDLGGAVKKVLSRERKQK